MVVSISYRACATSNKDNWSSATLLKRWTQLRGRRANDHKQDENERSKTELVEEKSKTHQETSQLSPHSTSRSTSTSKAVTGKALHSSV